MPNCGPNTLFIGRASQQQGCALPCDNLGPADCLNASQLTPRRNRGKVIEQIKEYVLLMLGAPVIDVELDEQQLDMAVKQTLKVMEYYAPQEYFNYYTFLTVPGKSVYKMPPDVGYIRHVAYRETSEFAFQAQDLGGSIPIEYFAGGYTSMQGGLIDPVQPIFGRMGDWAAYKGVERMYARLSSALGGWEFVGGYSNIKIYPIPLRAHRVIVHYMQRCHDWEETTLCMQEGALFLARQMCGTIRKKFASLPGPGGGIQLDGEQMYQDAKQDYEKWKDELITKWGDLLPVTLG